jgi:CheY-like chemotaxis protein
MAGPRPPSKPATGRLPAGARPNTLGLGQRELGELLDRFESPEPVNGKIKRDFVRWPFRHTSLRIQIFHPGGATAVITVACRNISRAGIAILHSSYMHPGTKCQVILPHPTRGELPVDGWVTRCIHRSGVVHEIGIRFASPIDVQEILRPDPLSDWFSLEKVNPQDLTGSVVYVDDSEIDRQIVRHFVRETRLTCSQIASAAEAISCIDDTTDLVLLDYHLTDTTGTDLAAKLRQSGRKMPIVIVTCDTQAALAAGDTHISAFLAKPLSQETLLRALGEFLIVRKRGDRGGNGSALSGAGNQLAEGISAALTQYANRLEDCLERQDVPAARTVCLQIAGTAGAGGFKEINALASKAAENLSRNQSISESINSLRTLIAACQSAGKMAKAAAKSAPR